MSSRALPSLSNGQLETLLAALDPRLEGFGSGGSELDDAAAYIARLGLAGDEGPAGPSPLISWLSAWSATGANRESLALAVATLLADRQASRQAQTLQLLWGEADQTLLQDLPALLATVEQRLLLVFGPGADGETLQPLREAIQVRLHQVPNLDLLAVAPAAAPLLTAAEPQPGAGLQLLVCDDLLRWQSGPETVSLQLLAPSLELRSQSQADGAWRQVQRLLAEGQLQALAGWSPAALA
ncbi:MAG: hypothetical protein RLZZ11_1194 [Cyanobacteriota bacterium]|jgi:hypothetical protein